MVSLFVIVLPYLSNIKSKETILIGNKYRSLMRIHDQLVEEDKLMDREELKNKMATPM